MSSVYSKVKNNQTEMTNNSKYIKGVTIGAISALSLLAFSAQNANASTVTVKDGDTIWDFAQKYHVSVQDLEAKNASTIKKVSSSVDLIYAGQKIELSGTTATQTTKTSTATATSSAAVEKSDQHVVQNGETLSEISAHYGVSLAALEQANGISNPDEIVAGQVLTIPNSETLAKTTTVAPSAAPASAAPVANSAATVTDQQADAATTNSAASQATSASAQVSSSAASQATNAPQQSSAVASSAPAAQSTTATNSSVATSASSQASSVAPAATQTTQSANATTANNSNKQSTPTTNQSSATTSNANLQSGSVVSLAVKLAGANIPYVWGGSSLSGMDCSGLIAYVYSHAEGINLPHYTVALESSVNKHSVASAQPGDILFWGSAGATYHAAIYIGNNQYVAAPTEGQNVQIQTISSYFMPSFAGTVK
jgi:cell wall-associated NlpC family hydrolase